MWRANQTVGGGSYPFSREAETRRNGDRSGWRWHYASEKKTFNLRFPHEIRTTIAHFCSSYMDKYAQNQVTCTRSIDKKYTVLDYGKLGILYSQVVLCICYVYICMLVNN